MIDIIWSGNNVDLSDTNIYIFKYILEWTTWKEVKILEYLQFIIYNKINWKKDLKDVLLLGFDLYYIIVSW